MTSKMLSVNKAQNAKMANRMTLPYKPSTLRPMCMTIVHKTSDNSRGKIIEKEDG